MGRVDAPRKDAPVPTTRHTQPPPAQAGDYQVRLDAFEGPLDLLLFLIRRAEVEVTDIPISTIADQYLDYLGHISTIDIDRAGEFLVMAATLTEIKARMLAPPSAREGSEGEDAGATAAQAIDPRADLIRQLLDYKKYRDAAAALDKSRRDWESRYPTARAPIDRAALTEAQAVQNSALLDMEDVTLADLVDAFSKILSTVDLSRVGEHHVTVDDTPIELHAADILDRLRRESAPLVAGVPFAAIFAGRTRAEMIGLFLAMLELVRQRKVRVLQERLHGEILLSHGEEAAAVAAPEVVVTPQSAVTA